MGDANTKLNYPVSKLTPSPLLNLHPEVIERLGDAAYMSQAVRRLINLSDLYRLLEKDPAKEYYADDFNFFGVYLQAHGLMSGTDTIKKYLETLRGFGLLRTRTYGDMIGGQIKFRAAYLVKQNGNEEDETKYNFPQ